MIMVEDMSDPEASEYSHLNDTAKAIVENSEYPPIWGKNWINTYVKEGLKESFENDDLNGALALGLLGQAVGDAWFSIDQNRNYCKLHILAVQDSGTGKDPAFDFAERVADEADMNFVSYNKINSAGLIGGVAEDGNGVEPGDAKDSDVIAFREATNLFDAATESDSSTMAKDLNQVMDGKEVRKTLGSGTIEFRPSCSILGTTYPPSELDMDVEEFMKNGTLSRFLMFFKKVDEDFYWKVGNKMDREVQGKAGKIKDVEDFRRLSTTLEVLQHQYSNPNPEQNPYPPELEFEFAFDPEAVGINESFKSVYDEHLDSTREVSRPTINRYRVATYKIGTLIAALDRCSTTVTTEHMKEATTLMEKSWRQMLQFISSQLDVAKEREDRSTREKMQTIIQQQPGIKKGKLTELLGVTDRTIEKHADTLASKGVIEKDKDGRQRVYEPVVGEDQ
jgi:DNA-binding transcriptional ArsR family regulator